MFSCTRPDKINRIYILENGTEHSIRIDFFEYSMYRYSNTIEGKGILSTGKQSEFEGQGEISALQAFGADSVVIIFNNSKRQIFTYERQRNRFYSIPELTSNNILNDTTYIIENIESFRYIFTDEDYENAEDL
jgi:hypothetical protein